MDTLLLDIRYALRALVKNPGFAAVAVLTLAIGIGANTAIFTVVEAALLRSLPYQNVDRLVYVSETNPRDNARLRQASYPDYVDWKRASIFESVAGFGGAVFFAGTESPERIGGGRITADFFKVLGVQPTLGRHFTQAEENGEGRVVIVSNGFWQRRLGSDPNVVGQSIILSGANYTVAGVLPVGFHFAPLGLAEVWTPLNPTPPQRERRFMHWLYVLGRLKDRVTLENAQPELVAIGARIAELDAQYHAETSVRAGPLSEPIVGRVRPVIIGLFVAVGLVLLIACANVANLTLARAAGRQREIAIRVAVGANRRRLVRQLLTETILLSLIGGAIGMLFAGRGVDLLIAGIPENQLNTMPFLRGATIDGGVLLFTMAAAILTGVFCGLFPAIQASTGNIRAAIAPPRKLFRNALVVAEVALALVLLIAAGLLMKSMMRLLQVDPGFNSASLTTMRVSLMADHYQQQSRQDDFFRRVESGIESLPGVQGVTAVDVLPLSGGGQTGTPTIEGRTEPEDVSANIRTVFGKYFEVMGIPLIKGRHFSDRDTPNSPMVVLVNEMFVSSLFRGEEPLNRRITFAFTPNVYFQIVGVVGDENVTGLDAPASPVIYFPFGQDGTTAMSLVVRTASDPATILGAIRARINEVDSTAASSLLFGVTATDPAVFGSVAAIFMVVTLIACYVPARRATRVDPLAALRE